MLKTTAALVPMTLVLAACGGRLLGSSPEDAGTMSPIAVTAGDGTDAQAPAAAPGERTDASTSGVDASSGYPGARPDASTSGADAADDAANADASDGASGEDSGSCSAACAGQCVSGRCLVTLASGDEPIALAVDADNVYFTDYDGTVNEVPVGGGAVTVLATGVGYPWGIAIDATTVYFAAPDIIFNGVNAWIGSVPIGGGTTTTLASGTVGGRVMTVLDGMLYWDSGGYETSTNAEISNVSVDGGAAQPFVPITPGGFYEVPGIAASDGLLFFSEEALGIESQAPTATTATLLSSTTAGPLALDDANIYTVSTDGVVAISRTTGAATTLVPGNESQITDSPTSVATDGTNVYWTNYYGIGQSSVFRVPVGGGSVTTMASGQNDTSSVVLDAQNAYWIAGGLVQKISKD